MRCSAFQILRETAKWALDRPPLERAVEALEIAGVLTGHDVRPPIQRPMS